MRHKTLIIAIIAYIMMCSAVISAQAVSMYVVVDGVQSGPFDWDTLKQMVSVGQMTEQSLVWDEGLSEWTPAKEISYLEGLFQVLYYIAINNEQYGPYNKTQLEELYDNNQLNEDTLVWSEDIDLWTPAGEIPNLEELFQILYYVVINGEQYGPYNNAQIEVLSTNNQLTKDSLIWSKNMNNWKPIGETIEFAKLFEENTQEVPIPQNENLYGMNEYEQNSAITEYTQKYGSNVAYGCIYLISGLCFLAIGAIGMPLLLVYGIWDETTSGWATTISGFASSVGSALVGIILTPLCALFFPTAYRLRANYKRAIAFLQRSSIDGGYDFENKEVTVAMAIKL